MSFAPMDQSQPSPATQEYEDTSLLQDLQQQKDELLNKVHVLKTELQDWRVKLDVQVKTYKAEIGELRTNLNHEIDSLRTEFMDLKQSLKQQLEQTAALRAEPLQGTNGAAQDGSTPAQ